MEAATLKKKSTGLSKGKLKKTIKNVLCRPDSIQWRTLSEENERSLRNSLSKCKVDIPEFKKLQWNELKMIPKNERPKPPPVKKPDGLIFGLRHCSEAIVNKQCSALLLDSEVNPRSIVQSVIELCTGASVPFICLKQLKELSLTNFGFKTACLGVKLGCLKEISDKIAEIAKVNVPRQAKSSHVEEVPSNTSSLDEDTSKIANDVEMSEIAKKTEVTNYLLKRISKKSRVFVPPSYTGTEDVKKKFIGQNFIEFSEHNKKEMNNENLDFKHTYKNMMLKRITNNPNRAKKGKKRKTENAK